MEYFFEKKPLFFPFQKNNKIRAPMISGVDFKFILDLALKKSMQSLWKYHSTSFWRISLNHSICSLSGILLFGWYMYYMYFSLLELAHGKLILRAKNSALFKIPVAFNQYRLNRVSLMVLGIISKDRDFFPEDPFQFGLQWGHGPVCLSFLTYDDHIRYNILGFL